LWDVVDYFVLIEATITHSGKPKPLYYDENKQRFYDFSKKIIHIIVKDMPITKEEIEASLSSKEATETQTEAVNSIIRNATKQALDILSKLGEDKDSFRKLGLTFEEKAFYDILMHLRDKYNFEYGKDKKVGSLIINDKKGLGCFGVALNGSFAQQKETKKETKKESAQSKKEEKSETKLKKDGTPDMRFKENKEAAKPKPAGPLKKDGTPDKRYKENKGAETKK
jgi:hypothetical protein